MAEQAVSSAQVYCFLGLRVAREGSQEVRGRLESILSENPRRLEIFRFVERHTLFRDLDFLAHHVSAGDTVRTYLGAITGREFKDGEDAARCVRKYRDTLRWDSKSWRYGEP